MRDMRTCWKCESKFEDSTAIFAGDICPKCSERITRVLAAVSLIEANDTNLPGHDDLFAMIDTASPEGLAALIIEYKADNQTQIVQALEAI